MLASHARKPLARYARSAEPQTGASGLLARALLFFVLCLASSVASAQIGISPQKYDVVLGGATQTHTFRLFNFSDTPREMAVTVSNWRMDEANRVEVIPPTESSLDQWIIINPLKFVIPPGESQAVRFAVRPAVKLDDGEHRAMIYFTEQLPPDDDPSKVTMRSRLRIGAAVYAQVGEVVRQGTIDRVEGASDSVTLAITNTGSANTRLVGNYAIRSQTGISEGLPEGLLPQTAVLPGDSRNITLSLHEQPLTAGRYEIHLTGSLGSNAIDRSWQFIVP